MNHWIDIYRKKTDEELLRIATGLDLLPEAQDALQEVLASRKLGEAEIAEYADDLNWIDVQQIIQRPDLSRSDLLSMLNRGVRLVVFQYCLSFIVFSVKRTSRAYLVAPGQSSVVPGLPYTFVALALGVWGIPWGVLWAFSSAYKNLGGGIDVTPLIKDKLNVVPSAGHGSAPPLNWALGGPTMESDSQPYRDKMTLAAHWAGHASLASAYWLVGTLGFWLVYALAIVAYRLVPALAPVAIIAVLTVSVFGWVSIWRCWRNTNWATWGYVARACVIIYALLVTAVLFTMLSRAGFIPDLPRGSESRSLME